MSVNLLRRACRTLVIGLVCGVAYLILIHFFVSPAHPPNKVAQAKAELRLLASLVESASNSQQAISLILHGKKDVFSQKEDTYQYVQDASRMIIYSVGPDGIDNKANLEYSPDNGPTSSGDIIQYATIP